MSAGVSYNRIEEDNVKNYKALVSLFREIR